MNSLKLTCWMLALAGGAAEPEARAGAALESATTPANRFVVDSTADPGDGIAGDGELTLREAIVLANATPNRTAPDLIVFQVPPIDPGHLYFRNDGVAGQVSRDRIARTAAQDDALLSDPDPDWPRSWYSISLSAGLPPITQTVSIDGRTQPGYAGLPLIELNATRAASSSGLVLNAGSNEVRGLVINQFLNGIEINAPGGNVIEGNFIGTDAAGISERQNGYGIFVNASPNNRIGGSTENARNVLSGNVKCGVTLSGAAATGNRVQGNYLGTDRTGTVALRNYANGVLILDAPGNLIGGVQPRQGNLISGNGGPGIEIQGQGAVSNRVEGNVIGMNAAGKVRLANGGGIQIWDAARNTIGGPASGAGNLISGNGNFGIDLRGAKSNQNTIQGNRIGTDGSGTVTDPDGKPGNGDELGNGGGVQIQGSGNRIGGAEPGAGNLISGNTTAILISADTSGNGGSGNIVQGNRIGTDATGTRALGNGRGVYIGGADNVVGGSATGAGNLISGNLQDGVWLYGLWAHGNLIQGNSIGTDAKGRSAIPNRGHGIFLMDAPRNLIGGTAAAAGNVVGSNQLNGILISGNSATSNRVAGNFIGTSRDRTAQLGNGGSGVGLISSLNQIGGVEAQAGNVIAFNHGDGVAITTGAGNAILGNSIYSNTGLGIDLADEGPNVPQDPGDGDAGANNRQNFPALTAASPTATTLRIEGSLQSAPGRAFRIEFFSSDALDPSGFGEGQTPLGSVEVSTGSSGEASIAAEFPTATAAGQFITATATRMGGEGLPLLNDTSEFSPGLQVTVPEPADFGDAPVSYGTLLRQDGARHTIRSSLHLGSRIDAEPDGQPNAGASGDDISNEDDEDGVTFAPPLEVGGVAEVEVTASAPGLLNAWVDFNRNGSWQEPDEHVVLDRPLLAGMNGVNFRVPASAQPGPTFARFRFSTRAGLSFRGAAPDGEVEDYAVTIEGAAPPCQGGSTGRDFWLTFPGNYAPDPTNSVRLRLLVVGNEGARVEVSIPGLQWSNAWPIPAAGLLDVPLPAEAELGASNGVVEDKGIHVTATAPVSVYGLNELDYTSDGYLALPVEVLGQEYVVQSYPNVLTGMPELNGTQFALVACARDTRVTITATPNANPCAAALANSFLLQPGQTLQLRGVDDAPCDLSGLVIASDSPIAVFGSHQCANVNGQERFFCDYLVEQLPPVQRWGMEFIVAPLATRSGGDTFRCVAARDDTELTILSGNAQELVVLQRGMVLERVLRNSAVFRATEPILVTQYASSWSVDRNENADPLMVLVPAVAMYRSEYRFAVAGGDFASGIVHVIVPDAVGDEELRLDGGAFVPEAGYEEIGWTEYRAGWATVSPGMHTLTAPSPFGAMVYGFARYEAYGWPAGVELGDTRPPEVICPPDEIVNLPADGPCEAVLPDLRPQVAVTENCTPLERVLLTQNPAPGSRLGEGAHRIRFTAVDAAGNAGRCEMTFTVTADCRGASITLRPQEVTITWPGTGHLQTATAVNGPWTEVPGAKPPYSLRPESIRRFFRVMDSR